MTLKIKAEAMPGMSIDRAAVDAQRIADTLRCDVEFSHNGVRCIALAGGSANALVERWGYEIKRKVTVPNDFRLATSRPANPTIAKEPQDGPVGGASLKTKGDERGQRD